MFNKTLCLSKSRIKIVLVFVRVANAQMHPTRMQTRDDLSDDDDDDDGLLFELESEHTGFDGIFEEQ